MIGRRRICAKELENIGASQVTQWAKELAKVTSLWTRVLSGGTYILKERTKSCKMSSDFHTHARHAHTYRDAHVVNR